MPRSIISSNDPAYCEHKVECDECSGTGVVFDEDLEKEVDCLNCDGEGWVMVGNYGEWIW